MLGAAAFEPPPGCTQLAWVNVSCVQRYTRHPCRRSGSGENSGAACPCMLLWVQMQAHVRMSVYASSCPGSPGGHGIPGC